MSNSVKILAEFPFQSRFIDIEGSKMHYIDKGAGNPIIEPHFQLQHLDFPFTSLFPLEPPSVLVE